MRFDQAEFEAAYGTASQLPPPTLPEIAFAGRSNVGKSSLINKLANRKALARTSSTPGKTGTVNFYKLGEARLVDLPGYGYAKVSQTERARWAKLMDGYFSGERRIELLVQLVDMRHPPTQDDLQMMDFLKTTGIPFFIVLSKSDKLKKTEREKRMEAFGKELGHLKEISVLPFSAVNGEGVKEIQDRIAMAVQTDARQAE